MKDEAMNLKESGEWHIGGFEGRKGRNIVIICNFKKKRKINKKLTNAGKNMRKCEPLFTANMDANWSTHYRNKYGNSSKKLKIELPYSQLYHSWL